MGPRLRNLIVFLAIVWGVATTFVAFEVVALTGFDLVRSFPGVVGELGLSKAVTESTSCAVPAGHKPESHAPAISQTDAQIRSWSLGVNLGRDAVVRQFAASDRQLLEDLALVRTTLAAQLAVPALETFTPRQMATANIEFVEFVEQGRASETARRLAVAFSPQACELFKLGALWGYSEVVRPILPGERAVFAMEIRHHAMRAGIPEPLWSPMLERTPADARGDDIVTQMETLTNGMTSYVAGQR
jgi:hypothetical protein